MNPWHRRAKSAWWGRQHKSSWSQSGQESSGLQEDGQTSLQPQLGCPKRPLPEQYSALTAHALSHRIPTPPPIHHDLARTDPAATQVPSPLCVFLLVTLASTLSPSAYPFILNPFPTYRPHVTAKSPHWPGIFSRPARLSLSTPFLACLILNCLK